MLIFKSEEKKRVEATKKIVFHVQQRREEEKMEQNLSNVCVATIHKSDQHKSSRLPPDDVMPLYATIIPENTRKAR